MRHRQTQLLVLGAVALLVGAAIAPAMATATEHDDGDQSAFVVETEANGDATVSLTLTYDLSEERDEAAFEEVRENSTVLADRFDERLSRIADRTSNETDREMTVSDANSEVTTADGLGTVELSVSWSNLAAVDGETLVVTEPFSSGFQPDRTFVLTAPDGYAVTETTVPADEAGTATAEWEPGTDLSGFSATVSPSEDPAEDDDETTDSSPVPVGSILGAVFLPLSVYGVWNRL